jgi:hypothetical protein
VVIWLATLVATAAFRSAAVRNDASFTGRERVDHSVADGAEPKVIVPEPDEPTGIWAWIETANDQNTAKAAHNMDFFIEETACRRTPAQESHYSLDEMVTGLPPADKKIVPHASMHLPNNPAA